jgi:hypothetical protein
VNGQKK